MAGGYTLLNDPAEREKDKKTNGGNMEGEKEPLRVPDDTLTPELTCVPPDPPRDLISVFVVTFDPKEGNLLEWSVPKGVSLDGIEFRALISGAHTITSDFIYFRQGDFYGAACYQKMELSSEVERGVRMKSVGVIVAHYTHLHPHLTHLAHFVRYILCHPGHYENLEDYFHTRRAPSPPPTSWHAPPRVSQGGSPAPQTPATPATPSSPALQAPFTTTPQEREDASLHQLLQALGDQLVYIWRASLLCKRILLFSEPPIGRKCLWVHWLSLLGAHGTPGLPSALLRPLYYVSLADLDLLAEQHAYVACTTEKIFEEKTGIYDLYIEGHKVRITQKHPAVTTITTEDRLRVSALLSQPDLTPRDLYLFFKELNDSIFAVLYRASGPDGSGVVGAEDLGAVGLNGAEDCGFVRELVATHGFDVSVKGRGCVCCPCVL